MNRYCKIKVLNSFESNYKDSFPPLDPQSPSSRTAKKSEFNKPIPKSYQDHKQEDEEEDFINEPNSGRFGGTLMKLSRNSSVSAVQSHRFGLQSATGIPNRSSTYGAVKKAFSLRRSSSVTDQRYSRIHDHDEYCSTAFDHQKETAENCSDSDGRKLRTRSVKIKSSSERILKACKRIFGIH